MKLVSNSNKAYEKSLVERFRLDSTILGQEGGTRTFAGKNDMGTARGLIAKQPAMGAAK
ncbi:hypothetical protein ACQCVP_17255 [Rossellomorea vietnamensis]|uniref:hypothetical protein n=1 Tax=Rossellomorea vietnamensis TaxID=218284 RepID=UPI003CF1C06A